MESRTTRSRPNVIQRLKQDLRANPKKRIVLLALLPLMVVVWVPVLKGGSSSKSAPRATGTSTESQPVEPMAPPEPVDFELRDHLGELMSRLGDEWAPSWRAKEGEQPFGAPNEGAGGRQRGVGSGDSRSPSRRMNAADEEQLAATLYPTTTFLSDKNGNLAIIDGEHYRVGDEIEHFVIREIKTRAVVLTGLFGEYELSIPLDEEKRR